MIFLLSAGGGPSAAELLDLHAHGDLEERTMVLRALGLLPVTDGDRTFWSWEGSFTTRRGEEVAMSELVGEQIYQAGFDAKPLPVSHAFHTSIVAPAALK